MLSVDTYNDEITSLQQRFVDDMYKLHHISESLGGIQLA
jgi:hypothetical protein